MAFILGKKIGMSQIFDDKGNVIPVSVLEAGPCLVTHVKTMGSDGYEAVQIGYGEKKAKNVSKAVKGHIKKILNSPACGGTGKFQIPNSFTIRWLREFRVNSPEYKLGDKIDVSIFSEGDKVKISGISKGKGFQGVVKRHGFSGGPASHGHRHVLRTAGSTGSRFPQHTRKGRRMAGHAGYERITVKNLKIAQIDKENNLIAIKGAVPGHRGTLLEIVGK